MDMKKMRSRKKAFWVVFVTVFGWSTLLFGSRAEATDCSYIPEGELFQNTAISIQDDTYGVIQRTFDYYIPPECYPSSPQHQLPLVFILHGRDSSADSIFATSGYYDWGYPWCRMMKEADRDRFIICAPDGWVNAKGEQSWNDCQYDFFNYSSTDDVVFIEALIRWFIKNGYNIDANRIYAAGFSNGAGMAYRLAIELSDSIAAVAAVGANTARPADNECGSPAGDIGVLIMNGTADPIVAYEFTQNVVDYWVMHNNLSPAGLYERLPDIVSNPEQPTVNLWADLYRYNAPINAEGTQVLHYAIHNGGHAEPSITEQYPEYYEIDRGAGFQCHDFEVAEEVWKFFQTQSLAQERVYRPTDAAVLIGSGSGTASKLWLDDTEGGGSYSVNASSGEAMLQATFSLPDLGAVRSLRVTTISRTSVSMPWSLHLWNDAGSGGWHEILANTAGAGENTSEVVITSDVADYVNSNREVIVAIRTGDAGGAGHQLMVDLVKLGVIFGSAGSVSLQAANDKYTVSEETLLTVNQSSILSNDSPSTGVTALLVDTVDDGTLMLNSNGTFSYLPNLNFSGTDSFTYKTSDGASESNIATVSIGVTPVNDAPIAINDIAAAVQGTATTLSVLNNDIDVDEDTLQVTSITQGSSKGSVVNNGNGTITYTSIPSFVGTETFTYKAYDGKASSNSATVTVTVRAAVNRLPIARNDYASTTMNVPVTINLIANDTDSDGSINPATVTVVSPPKGTVVNNGNGTVTFTPALNFRGIDALTYNVKDNRGAVSNTATVSVTVRRGNSMSIWPWRWWGSEG